MKMETSLSWRRNKMPKTYKELHAEKLKLEQKETLASVRQTIQLVRICAENSTNFEEFTKLLNDAIAKVEAKMEE